MARLYLSDAVAEAGAGERIVIGGDEARHAVVVSRLRPGEPVLVGDGAGTQAHGAVVEAAPGRLVVELGEIRRSAAARPQLWLAQALAKGDRDELAVQAATELGVDRVIPWAAARSVVRWDPQKAQRMRQRWESIAREAVKQSLRPHLPSVDGLATTEGLLALGAAARIVVLEPAAEARLSAFEGDGRDILLVAGPEGGIDPAELQAFREAGAEVLRLGESVLRTSTAGPAAIAVLSARLGRW